MRVPVLVAGLLLACSIPAGAADVVVNNGLDCSNPGNVIEDATYQSDRVFVRNVGCGTPDPGSPCPSPGAATEVCVEAGGNVYGLYVYDSSAVTMSGGTTDTGEVPSANVWQLFKIEVTDTGSQTQIRAKVWPEGTPEPGGWQVDCFDDNGNRLTVGTVGLWSMGPEAKYWDDLQCNMLPEAAASASTHKPLDTGCL